jgi:predicted Co/Zn/Cd cation transporter (cation efflux family)
MQTNLPNDMAGDITERIEKINNDYDFSDRVLRLAKVGSKIIVEVDYVLKENSQLDSVSEQDRLRGRFAQAFAELPYKIWMNVNFTSEAKWTEHVIIQG